MPIEVVMPRLGWNMESGALVEWLKHDGDQVEEGDIICTIESDKAVNEIESMDRGILRIPSTSPPAGEQVPIGTLLAYLLEPEEEMPAAPSNSYAAAAQALAERALGDNLGDDTLLAAPSAPEPETDSPTASPRARRTAAELGVDLNRITPTGRAGRISERDVRAAARAGSPGQDVSATPSARRLAADSGADLAAAAGRSPSRGVTASDVDAVASARATASQAGGQIRQVIARRMTESAHTVAAVTLTTEVDATALVDLRNEIKASLADSETAVPAYNDLLIRIVALALLDHPDLNASFEDGKVIRRPEVNVGLAVDTDRGLLVPVVRDAARLSVASIAAETKRLVQAAHAGQATSEDLSGSTFTITNLGMFDIDAFTPIINLPECAVLGVGRISARPVVIDDETEELGVRKMMNLSLTFDHRIVDGAPAARFLRQVKRYVERPTLWLIR